MSRQPLPDREWVIVYPRRIVGGSSPAMPSQTTTWGWRIWSRSKRTGFKKLLPDCICGTNFLAAFIQDAEAMKKTIEIDINSNDVGSFIMFFAG